MSNLKSLIIVFPLLLISCGGGGSGSNDSDAALKVVSINFSSNLNEIFIHNKITLTWASSNASSCNASGDWNGLREVNGSEEIIIRDAKESTFTLTCSSSGSSAEKNIRVTSISPYSYADHWDEINSYIESLKSVYKNPVGFNQEEIWFKTFTIPKSKFLTDIENTTINDENFRGNVG